MFCIQGGNKDTPERKKALSSSLKQNSRINWLSRIRSDGWYSCALVSRLTMMVSAFSRFPLPNKVDRAAVKKAHVLSFPALRKPPHLLQRLDAILGQLTSFKKKMN
eukprot:Lithocolla_globosa_v1_NODE_537_length_3794_cov_22.651976.p2 type:complete len:106 gc:universal NODE_537_length_3794_cov_22.651976:733-1050(+)